MRGGLYKRSRLREYVMVIIGTGLLAASIQCIYDPINLVTGGFTGLSIIVKEVTAVCVSGGVPLWLTNIALNICLLYTSPSPRD